MTMPDRIWADAPGVFDDCDIWRGEQVEGATEYIRADLHEAALTQSQAETAAAYATATHTLDKWAVNLRDMNFPETAPIVDQCSAMVRALVTPDQRAALDAVRAKAVRPYIDALIWCNNSTDFNEDGGAFRSRDGRY